MMSAESSTSTISSPTTTTISAKSAGNALFGQGLYAQALDKYDEALAASSSINPTQTETGTETEKKKELSILWSNRCACNLALEQYSEAEEDARDALRLDQSSVKVYYR